MIEKCLHLGGLQLQAISSMIAVVMTACVKALGSTGIPLFQIILARALILLAFASFLCSRQGISPFSSDRKLLLVLRGSFGFCMITSVYASVNMMPLADAAVLGFLAPVFVAALSPLVLGEPTSKAVFIALPLAFLGVIMVTQPPALFGKGTAASLGTAAILVGLSRAFFGAAAKLSVSYLGKTEPLGTIVFAMALFSCVGSALLCFLMPSQWPVMPARLQDWALLVGVGVCACGVQITATTALKRAAASPVVVMSYTGIIWSMCFDAFAFGNVPKPASFLGAALVASASVILLLYDGKKGQADSSSASSGPILPENRPLLVELSPGGTVVSPRRRSLD